MTAPHCPPSERLADYALGKLPLAELDELELHLDKCPDCQATIDRLDSPSDTFIHQLKQPAAPNPFCQEPALLAAIAAASQPPGRTLPPPDAAQPPAPPAAPPPPDAAQPPPPPAAPPPAAQPRSKPAAKGWTQGQAPKTLEDFVRCLVASQLMTLEEVQTYLRSLPASQRPTDAKSAALHLVQAGKLTKYQARLIYQGEPYGLVIADREVLDLLGHGGMGNVYKVRNRRLDRIEALKVILPKKLDSADAVQRFQREARAAARIHHPHVVATFDAGEVGGQHYLSLEFVDGCDLAQTVKQQGPLSVEHAVSCIIQAASGLHAAHEAGIIHRDIKPHNLLLDRQGKVKILDLGLARLQDDASRAAQEGLTQSGQIMGTIDYMSPEQTLDVRKVTPASDVYSLGCTLHYLLTGKTPYQAETLGEKMMAHHQRPIPSLAAERPDVSPALDAVFQKLLAKDPAERYATMPAVISALQALATPAPATAPPLAPPPASNENSDNGRLNSFLSQLVVSRDLPRPPGSPAAAGPALTSPLATAALRAPQAAPRRRSSHLVILALGAAALAVLLLGVVFTIQTPEGTIEVRLPDGAAADQVKVVVSAGGKQVAIIDQADRFQVQLREGQYHVTLQGDDATFALTKNSVTVKQGQAELVTVTRRPLPSAVTLSTPPLPSPPPPTPVAATPQFMLEFDGKSYVDIPNYSDDGAMPLTFEARLSDGVDQQYRPGNYSAPLFNTYSAVGPAPHATSLALVSWEIDLTKSNPEFHAVRGATGTKKHVYRTRARAKGVEVIDLAIVYDKTETRCYINGLRVNHYPFDYGTISSFTKGDLARIGNWATPRDGYRGLIERIRISKSARYTANYTPPKTFEPDADTYLLYKMDEGTGDILKDSSGNNLHGKIVGAKWVSAASQTPSPPPATPSAAPPKVPTGPRVTEPVAEGSVAGEAKEFAGIQFRWCPAGAFTMGSPAGEQDREDNENQVEVTLSRGFWLGETEVTQGQWQRVLGASSAPWKGNEYVREGADYPAVDVSHGLGTYGVAERESAVAFCETLTVLERAAGRLPVGCRYRLPTEAEWEYACRAGTKSAYSFREAVARLGEYAWFDANAGDIEEEYAHLVGQKRANPWGFKDMHGNVWEWCSDWLGDTLPGGRDPRGAATGSGRAVRGGGWGNSAGTCRSASRSEYHWGSRDSNLGFRLALSLSGEPTAAPTPVNSALPATSAAAATEVWDDARHRALAQRVLELGGWLNIRVGASDWVEVKKGGKLPAEPFAVRKAYLNQTQPTVTDLASLSGCPTLYAVSLQETPLTAEIVAAIPKLSALEDLNLSKTAARVSWLKSLPEQPRLAYLTLNDTPCNDDDLALLEPLAGLKTLRLQGTQVTAAGVARLQAKLPKCSITWDGDPK